MTKEIGISETELRAKHDNTYKIREGVKKLQRSRFLSDQQMREFCNVQTNVWRSYSEKPEFDKYKMRLSGIWYWGIPQDIKRMKEDLHV